MKITEAAGTNLDQYMELLPGNDRDWLVDKITVPKVRKAVEILADQVIKSKWGKVKMKMRQDVESIDLMRTINLYSEQEQQLLGTGNLAIALNEKCSGWCSWCASMAQRMGPNKPSRAFSPNSIEKFVKKLGSVTCSNEFLYLYCDSDPLDWVVLGKTYPDISKVIMDNILDIDQAIYTSTVLPEGTEIAALRYMEYLYEVWLRNKKSAPNPLRFSLTKQNGDRLLSCIEVATALGIKKEFSEDTKYLHFSPRVTSKEISRIGFLINHPKRDPIKDFMGIECSDEIVIHPEDGIKSSVMEVVTLMNPKGRREDLLMPGKLRIPLAVDKFSYNHPLSGDDYYKLQIFSLLPKIQYLVYEGENFSTLEVCESVRRDALAFNLAIWNFSLLHDVLKVARKEVDNFGVFLDNIGMQIHTRFRERFEDRKKSCLSLMKDESDREAVKIAFKLIGEIDGILERTIKLKD